MSLRDGDFGYHDLERAALAFVLESETWPVFIEWAKTTAVTQEAGDFTASADLDEARKMWAEHSPNELIRALAADMP